MFYALLFKHIQHTGGNVKSAENVDGCKKDGEKQNIWFGGMDNVAQRLESSDNYNSRYGIGDAHQRRMQNGGNMPDGEITDET